MVLCTSSLFASQLSGEVAGVLGTEGLSSSFSFTVEQKNGPWFNWIWGLDAALELQNTLLTEFKTRWGWRAQIGPDGYILMNHNLPHITSRDTFRLVDKNQYSANSYSAILETPQLRLGALRHVPFKNADVVDAVFVESVSNLGTLTLTGVQLRYAGPTEGGDTSVLQAEGKIGPISALASQGWHTSYNGGESKAFVLELVGKGRSISGNFVAQCIDPGFASPLAKTNRYTPNRQGWRLDLLREYKGIELGFNLRRWISRDGTGNYNQLLWKLEAKDRHTSLEWRIEPTPAFIMRYALNDTLFQFDPINASLRTDFPIGDGVFSFRMDAMRSILRLEYKFQRQLEWHAVAKYDFAVDRSHYCLRVRHSGKNNYLQIEIGEYDRGNISSGFNNPPSLCISWGWKF